jgi:biopolymer transport protein ExbD
MPAKPKTFDVWIVENNTVYRQVPYAVVTDWVQQGRLLGDDRIRPTGTEKWAPVADFSAFSAFLPQEQPHQADDQAEALEPVRMDVQWKASRTESDDDVDMIPLIDVSLVLLIFFMMTATVGALSEIDTPEAEYLSRSIDSDMFWIGIEPGKPDLEGKPRYNYSLGQGETGGAMARFRDQYDQNELIKKVTEILQDQKTQVNIRVRADKRLPCELIVEDLTAALSPFKQQKKVRQLFFEVSEKPQP